MTRGMVCYGSCATRRGGWWRGDGHRWCCYLIFSSTNMGAVPRQLDDRCQGPVTDDSPRRITNPRTVPETPNTVGKTSSPRWGGSACSPTSSTPTVASSWARLIDSATTGNATPASASGAATRPCSPNTIGEEDSTTAPSTRWKKTLSPPGVKPVAVARLWCSWPIAPTRRRTQPARPAHPHQHGRTQPQQPPYLGWRP